MLFLASVSQFGLDEPEQGGHGSLSHLSSLMFKLWNNISAFDPLTEEKSASAVKNCQSKQKHVSRKDSEECLVESKAPFLLKQNDHPHLGSPLEFNKVYHIHFPPTIALGGGSCKDYYYYWFTDKETHSERLSYFPRIIQLNKYGLTSSNS